MVVEMSVESYTEMACVTRLHGNCIEKDKRNISNIEECDICLLCRNIYLKPYSQLSLKDQN